MIIAFRAHSISTSALCGYQFSFCSHSVLCGWVTYSRQRVNLTSNNPLWKLIPLDGNRAFLEYLSGDVAGQPHWRGPFRRSGYIVAIPDRRCGFPSIRRSADPNGVAGPRVTSLLTAGKGDPCASPAL